MPLPFRMIDTGVREGRANIAFDAALIELHAAGVIGDTVRFLQFKPTVLVGRHQAISRELKLAEARTDGIGIGRRITGGGAIYFDEGMLGWEVVVSRKRMPLPSLADYTRAICESVAAGLSRHFGIAARFRPRNDIEVEGRKLSGTGGFFDGDTLFYQGTVLIDADPQRVMAYLNVPRAKIERHGLDRAESRIVTLKALLGRTPHADEVKRAVAEGLASGLGLELQAAPPAAEEEARAAAIHADEIGRDEFVFEIDVPEAGTHLDGTATGAGGTVSAYVRIEGEGQGRRIREALITGDFFVTPPRLVFDLEAALRGVLVADAGTAVEEYFLAARPEMLSIGVNEFRQAVERALDGV